MTTIDQVHDVLKAGGRSWVIDPEPCSTAMPDPDDERYWLTAAGVRALGGRMVLDLLVPGDALASHEVRPGVWAELQ